jgi:poly(A) polymerase
MHRFKTKRSGIIREYLYLISRGFIIIKLLKGLVHRLTKKKPVKKTKTAPIIIPRAEHAISRKAINRNALKVLYRLREAGYEAYLVGGCVRDLLLKRHPKDFDIATNALPEEVRKIFRNSRLIGRRFRLAHIVFGREVIEVATFRTHHENANNALDGRSHEGMIIRDNVYGTIEDDAWRRDFRVNALYYNIADFSVIDYTGGMEDIQKKVLHMIGEPQKRFHEDPVRLLRAIRFAAKLHFSISPDTQKPIIQLSHLLQQVSSARLFQEVLKFFQEGATLQTVTLLQHYHLFKELFPETDHFLAHGETKKFIEEALSNTDQRIREGKTVSPAFLLTVFLWPSIEKNARTYEHQGLPRSISFEKAISHVLKLQTERLAIPRVLQVTIREMVTFQHRFLDRRSKQSHRLLEHPRFRAAYDFLLLRVKTDPSLQELVNWWTVFHTAPMEEREEMLKKMRLSAPMRKRKFRKKIRKPLQSHL